MKISKLHKIFQESKSLTIDSRKVGKESLFFALKGDNFNGNKFAKTALENGASYAVIDQKEYYISEKTILVKNSLETLQKLANFHRQQLDIPIIAITGTNGKTTTKELIKVVLSQQFNTFATPGNLNNHIGVPLSLLAMNSNTEIGIIEMGANHVGEIDFLCNIAEPNFGLITNVGTAHIEGFGSFEGVVKTKTELYRYIGKKRGTVFINIENSTLKKHIENIDIYTYGTNRKALTYGKYLNQNPFLNLFLYNKEKKQVIATQLVGKYNLENVLAAIAVGCFFKIKTNKIIDAIENYKPTNNRSQLVETDNNTLILDLYNANPSSMKVAIENFVEFQSKQKILILGDMLELGKDAEKEHNNIINLIKNYCFKNVFLVGNEFSKTNIFTTYFNVNQLIEHLKTNKITNKTILLKGSRGIQLEKCIEIL